MIESVVTILSLSWYFVGGFDWVYDMVDCINYVPTIESIYQYKITDINSIKNISEVMDTTIIDAERIEISYKGQRYEAIPRVKVTNIEAVKENVSSVWIQSKKTTGVLRIN